VAGIVDLCVAVSDPDMPGDDLHAPGYLWGGVVGAALAACGQRRPGIRDAGPDLRGSRDRHRPGERVRATGEVAVAGSKVTFDFRVHGSDFAGSFVLDGSTIQVLAVQGTFYIERRSRPRHRLRHLQRGGGAARRRG